MSMFCYQCQETARNQGCTIRGVCGKSSDVAALQDVLIYVLKGLSQAALAARQVGIENDAANRLVAEGLFATITNANFDPAFFVNLIGKAVALRNQLKQSVAGPLPAAAQWTPASLDVAALAAEGANVGVQADANLNEDVRSLRELLVYGIKGMAAYLTHAYHLGKDDPALFAFLQEALAATTDESLSGEALTALVLKCGEMGVQTMALLDAANTEAYGHPEPTQVNLGVRPGPGILVSGHDLRDLAELLEQTQGTGVNVYTHGEMLPANAYPGLKKYPNLVGNYGGSWWHQREEFDAFGGTILMTTNCIVPPKDSYLDRLYVTNQAGWPGAKYIPDRQGGQPKDFSALIAHAKALNATPVEMEQGTMPIGFAHEAVLSVAGTVIEAIKAGAVKRFVVMAGCDGRQPARSYFADVAQGLPADSIILTAGCAKYRYNKLNLGDIGGIPRVLDAGQCNDSYSLAVVALKLKEVFGLEDINDLP
ncbi:MAG: hydroxylamine reductase, partial [Chloroflexota bacterium]